jgi:hypothetical protein
MNQNSELVSARYDALMFAKSRENAVRAARELVRVVLGEEGLQLPLDVALRDCCRVLRPSQDPREQIRYETEFVELGIWPSNSRTMAA